MASLTYDEIEEVNELIKHEIARRVWDAAEISESDAYDVAVAIWKYLNSIGFQAPSAQTTLGPRRRDRAKAAPRGSGG